MADDRAPQTDEAWEGRLRDGLHRLLAGEPGGGLPGPDAARRTHARRRGALAAATALAVVVVTGGTVLALGGTDAAPPAAPTTTAAPAPSTPAPTPTGTPTTLAPPTTTTTTAPPTSSPAREVPTTIPDDYRLPSEGADADDPWQLVDDLTVTCGPDQVDLSAATDRRVLEQVGPEYSRHEALYVFGDVEDSLAALQDARDLGACVDGDARIAAEPVEGPWGEGVVVVIATPDEPGTPPAATYWLLVRTGTGVAVVGSAAEYASPQVPDPGVVASLVERVRPIAAELCRYTEAGC